MIRKLTYLGGLGCTSFLEIEDYNKEKELWRQIDCYCDEFEEMRSCLTNSETIKYNNNKSSLMW